VSMFDDLVVAAEKREAHCEVILLTVKLLLIESLPAKLGNAPENTIQNFDPYTFKPSRMKELPSLHFWTENRFPLVRAYFSIRVMKHTHVPFQLTFKKFQDRLRVGVEVFRSGRQVGNYLDPFNEELTIKLPLRPDEDSDLRRLGDSISQLALKYLQEPLF